MLYCSGLHVLTEISTGGGKNRLPFVSHQSEAKMVTKINNVNYMASNFHRRMKQ